MFMTYLSFRPHGYPQESTEPYVGGEVLSLNNFVIGYQLLSKIVIDMQPNDRNKLNLENVNINLCR